MMTAIDTRPLADLTFGLEAPEDNRVEEANWTRQMLSACGVKIAEDISKLGCTGVMRLLPPSICQRSVFEVIEDAKRVRLGMVGSECPLPCFISPDRYCLIHGTIGGLQEGQQPYHTVFIAITSRELTPEERGFVKRDAKETWTCPEHTATFWPCRLCVTAEIARSELEHVFVLGQVVENGPTQGVVYKSVEADSVGNALEAVKGDTVALFVQVGVWRRKMTRTA